MTGLERDYEAAVAAASTIDAESSREERMQAVVDLLWSTLHDTGVSWAGFYVVQSDAPEDERLVLGPRRDKPACSPIGMHGACGQALASRTTLIVRDVAELGEAYIACDPRDRSEIVIPLVDDGGDWWGVLDLDSFELAGFDERDEIGLKAVLNASGLLARGRA